MRPEGDPRRKGGEEGKDALVDRGWSSTDTLRPGQGRPRGCLGGLSFPSAAGFSHLLTSSAPGVCSGLGCVYGSRSSLTRPHVISSPLGQALRRSTPACSVTRLPARPQSSPLLADMGVLTQMCVYSQTHTHTRVHTNT